MELTELGIENSSSLDISSFTTNDRAIWNRLPDDYRAFLTEFNGGFIDSEKANFTTKIQRVKEGVVDEGNTNALEEFWSFMSYGSAEPAEGRPRSILHEHFGRHMGEEFLPANIYVIGCCIDDSLICISLNEADYRAMYYWDWYWRYPWHIDFFERRAAKVRDAYPDREAILGNTSNPRYQEVVDAFNYITLVKINDTFTGFLESLIVEAE